MKIQRASIVSATILSSAFLLSSCTNTPSDVTPTPQGIAPTDNKETPQSREQTAPRQKCGVTIYCMNA